MRAGTSCPRADAIADAGPDGCPDGADRTAIERVSGAGCGTSVGGDTSGRRDAGAAG